jgi:hypothetical protein
LKNITSPAKIHRLKGWKIIFQANRAQKQPGVSILISDKVDFKTKLARRNKEGHHTLTKGTIYQEDVTIVKMCALNVDAPNFIQAPLHRKGQIGPDAIVCDFSIPLSPNIDNTDLHPHPTP